MQNAGAEALFWLIIVVNRSRCRRRGGCLRFVVMYIGAPLICPPYGDTNAVVLMGWSV